MCTDDIATAHLHQPDPQVLHDFEPRVVFDLEPVDSVTVTMLMRFSQQLSADHLVLELREDERGLDDVADRGRADRDALQDAPPLRHQDRSSALRVFVSISSSPRAGFFTGTSTPAPAPS